ncbi:MAG: hypothetical protein H0V05_10985 [Euzebyaceae bacterium]|nr:hypothetical protein [Euzebyaceae bacterium]
MSLSDYLLRTRTAERVPVDQLWERAGRRDTSRLTETPAQAVRAERDAHG